MGETFNEKALLWKKQHEQEYLQNNNQVIPARFQVIIKDCKVIQHHMSIVLISFQFIQLFKSIIFNVDDWR